METDATICIELEHVSANSTYHTFRVAFHSATSRMLLPYPQVTGIRILDELGIKVGEWRTRVIGSVPVDDFVLTPKARIAFDLMAFVNCEPTPERQWTIELPLGKFRQGASRRTSDFGVTLETTLEGALRKLTHPTKLLKVCPRTSDFDDIRSPYHYRNFPDAGLVEMLQTGEEPERWDDMMDESEDWFGCTDLEENFRSYANIILEAKRGNWDAAVDAVRVSEELYETRPDMTDEVAVFEAWELPFPNKGIDLRLSALMRYCFRGNPEVLDPLNSVHRWKW